MIRQFTTQVGNKQDSAVEVLLTGNHLIPDAVPRGGEQGSVSVCPVEGGSGGRDPSNWASHDCCCFLLLQARKRRDRVNMCHQLTIIVFVLGRAIQICQRRRTRQGLRCPRAVNIRQGVPVCSALLMSIFSASLHQRGVNAVVQKSVVLIVRATITY